MSATTKRNGDEHLVSLIVPTLNEEANVAWVLDALPDVVDEVIVVDGGSTDATIDVVGRTMPEAKVVVDERKGKGRALWTGFEHASGDIIVIIDADGSMDPSEIPAMVALLLSGADVVKGSRFLQGAGTTDMEFHRRLGNSSLRLLVRALFGGRYSDLCYGYMGFWRHVLPAFEGDADGFEVETFMNVRALAAGLRITEVPSFEHKRISGVSNLKTFRDGLRVLMTILRERRALTVNRGGHGVPRPPVHPEMVIDVRDLESPLSGANGARRNPAPAWPMAMATPSTET